MAYDINQLMQDPRTVMALNLLSQSGYQPGANAGSRIGQAGLGTMQQLDRTRQMAQRRAALEKEMELREKQLDRQTEADKETAKYRQDKLKQDRELAGQKWDFYREGPIQIGDMPGLWSPAHGYQGGYNPYSGMGMFSPYSPFFNQGGGAPGGAAAAPAGGLDTLDDAWMMRGSGQGGGGGQGGPAGMPRPGMPPAGMPPGGPMTPMAPMAPLNLNLQNQPPAPVNSTTQGRKQRRGPPQQSGYVHPALIPSPVAGGNTGRNQPRPLSRQELLRRQRMMALQNQPIGMPY